MLIGFFKYKRHHLIAFISVFKNAVYFFFLLSCSSLAYAANNTICTDGFTLVNNKCWKLFTSSANHLDAERTCNRFGGTLFTVKNTIEKREMLSFLNNQKVDRVYMGLYCTGNDRSKCYWDDETGTTESFGNFASGFPKYDIGKCVYFSKSGTPSGQWATTNCNQNLPYVCELPTTTADNCTNNYNNNCYIDIGYWTLGSAQRECERICGNVVSVHSANENRYLQKFGVIGLGGMAILGQTVYWIDGSPVDYINMRNFSDGRCLFLNENGDFDTKDCFYDSYTMCKRPAGVPCVEGPVPPGPIAQYPYNPETCNTTLMMAPGYFTSPYSNDLPHNNFCTYLLGTTGAKRIILTFSRFNTEKNVDIVKVYDGDSDKSRLIGEYSGNLNNDGYNGFSLTSSGPNLYVTFASGQNHGYQGFEAHFNSIFY